MSRRERAARVGLAAVGTATVISLLHGSFLTVSMLWEIALWIGVFATLSLLDEFFKRRRRARRL